MAALGPPELLAAVWINKAQREVEAQRYIPPGVSLGLTSTARGRSSSHLPLFVSRAWRASRMNCRTNSAFRAFIPDSHS